MIGLTLIAGTAVGQSGRLAGYSESAPEKVRSAAVSTLNRSEAGRDDDVVRVETDLVTVPVRVNEKNGRSVTAISKEEFRIFEDGKEQQIAYFSDADQPFTVALLLDMSYSSVFKLREIQAAAKIFANQLRPEDRMIVISFAEKVTVLCEATNDRKILNLAINGSKIASGTSIYDAFGLTIAEKLRPINGRKAIVVLSDGVDTTSTKLRAGDVAGQITSLDVVVYTIKYATFDDVRESRRKDAEVQYDDDDRPYLVVAPLKKGQREMDYDVADDFINEITAVTGGAVFPVSSKTNLARAFTRISEELRKIYSLGYYPSNERRPGEEYSIKIRVYRPNLIVRARDKYSVKSR